MFRLPTDVWRPSDEDALARIDELYREQGVSGFGRWHLIERLRQIPHREIAAQVPLTGRILDIGSGRGGFTTYLALRGPDRRVCGIDNDATRLADALRVSRQLPNLTFQQGGLADLAAQPDRYDTILLMDILHHNPYADQEGIIRQAHALLVPGGRLVLLEAGDFPFLRYWGIWLCDFVLYFPWLTTCKYRNTDGWTELFARCGFTRTALTHITDRGICFTRKLLTFEKKP